MENKAEGYSKQDWQKHYDANDLRWDLQEPSPPFVHLWNEKKLSPGKTIIPGCGLGHEAAFLAERAFDVTAVDFSPGAVQGLNRILSEKKLQANVLMMDFFELDSTHNGAYDLMLEQTFFCAIAPAARSRYVDTAARILRKNGLLVALFYETGEAGGPPFNTTRDDVVRHFSGLFAIEYLGKTLHSIERRRGKEWLGFLRKNA